MGGTLLFKFGKNKNTTAIYVYLLYLQTFHENILK